MAFMSTNKKCKMQEFLQVKIHNFDFTSAQILMPQGMNAGAA